MKLRMRHAVRNDGCPTDWSTTAYNDPNLPDLHNCRILPYRPDDEDGPADAQERKRMAWNNPATVALWFMIRRLTTRMTLQRYELPMSYKKWWMRKFEFTQRFAVHEHEISKRVFMFPKYESVQTCLQQHKSLDTLTPDDFTEVEFRGDRLGSYTRTHSDDEYASHCNRCDTPRCEFACTPNRVH